jgi:uncharacterized membrane protein YqaE (UPF0057 family)
MSYMHLRDQNQIESSEGKRRLIKSRERQLYSAVYCAASLLLVGLALILPSLAVSTTVGLITAGISNLLLAIRSWARSQESLLPEPARSLEPRSIAKSSIVIFNILLLILAFAIAKEGDDKTKYVETLAMGQSVALDTAFNFIGSLDRSVFLFLTLYVSITTHFTLWFYGIRARRRYRQPGSGSYGGPGPGTYGSGGFYP